MSTSALLLTVTRGLHTTGRHAKECGATSKNRISMITEPIITVTTLTSETYACKVTQNYTSALRSNYVLLNTFRRLLIKNKSNLWRPREPYGEHIKLPPLRTLYRSHDMWKTALFVANKPSGPSSSEGAGRLETRRCCCGGTAIVTWLWYSGATRGIREGPSEHAPRSAAWGEVNSWGGEEEEEEERGRGGGERKKGRKKGREVTHRPHIFKVHS